VSERERYWRDVVERWSGSGFGVGALCRREGVSTVSFHRWRKRIAEADDAVAASARSRGTGSRRNGEAVGEGPLFVPVRVAAEEERSTAPGAAVEVALPSGVIVRVASGADRGTIADVLAALGVVG
jgi:hypothetical protein